MNISTDIHWILPCQENTWEMCFLKAITEQSCWRRDPESTPRQFLRRNLPSCPSHIKAQYYETLVRPTQEYVTTVWDPYTQENVEVEAVQRRATWLVRDYLYICTCNQSDDHKLWLPAPLDHKQQGKACNNIQDHLWSLQHPTFSIQQLSILLVIVCSIWFHTVRLTPKLTSSFYLASTCGIN